MEKQEWMSLFNLYIYSVGKAVSRFFDPRLIIRTVGRALQSELGEELRRNLGFDYPANGSDPRTVLESHSEFILEKGLAESISADLKDGKLIFAVENCTFAPATRLLTQEQVSPPPCLQVGFLTGVVSRCCNMNLRVQDYKVSLDDDEAICHFVLEIS